jgi:hypothetical protein
MKVQLENPDAAILDEETVSNASPQMRMNFVAEMAAYKSKNAVQNVNNDKNRLFSK